MVSFSDGLNPAGRQIPYGNAGNPVQAAASISPCPNGNGMLRTQNLNRGCFETNTSKPESQCSRATKSAHQEASHMKRNLLIALILMGAAGFAAAQIVTPTTDVLGAHLNYGRGCAACHAPHSGAAGNGANKSGDVTSGNVALWGEDVGNLYGRTITSGSTDGASGYTEILPTSLSTGTPDISGVLMCLSCHDGNYAQGAMMKNKVYESLPSTYGAGTIPTLLGADGTGTGNYLNDHPVGINAVMGCTGQYNWDCNISASGKVLMNGAKSSLFIQNYGFFVSPAVWNNQPVVMCTTCHNQHVMNVVNVKSSVVTFTGSGPTGTVSGNSGLPVGTYATMFFLRGPYNPNDANTATNQTAQFCRQCHGGESNEMNGSTAGTIM
jgi:hypothetical protein